MSRARNATFTLAHNSVQSPRECIRKVLELHPNIKAGTSTLFIVVESLCSIKGDFAPLREIVAAMHELVPTGAQHLFVDEAHTTGMCGPGGSGYVALLGLQKQVHTLLHTFGKAPGCAGAVVLTTPLIRTYLLNYSRPHVFATSTPFDGPITIADSCDIVEGELGKKLCDRLQSRARYLRTLPQERFRDAPSDLLVPPPIEDPNAQGLISPICPVRSKFTVLLSAHLQQAGYHAMPIQFPVVVNGTDRIRVVVYAGNTEEELKAFVDAIEDWAVTQRSIFALALSKL